jgi:UDP-3-O-[3-hydroxymyristoyl] glucosamine N-acyltransferase
MKKFSLVLTAEQISTRLGAEKRIIDQVDLNNVAQLEEADVNSVCFYENIKYLDKLKASRAGLIFVPIDFDKDILPQANLIFVDKPYLSYMLLIKTWLKLESSGRKNEISSSASISESARLGNNVSLGENVVIGMNSIIGDNTIIDSNTVIGENVEIGSDCYLFPNVTIYEDCILKNNVILHSSCVIGSDGFGYLLHEGRQEKIPQVGNVVIENDVEIGSNTSIDRATLGSTIIGEGTKIDNLVQIGHNCTIGRNTIICAQVGLAGSTEIGDYVYLAGQVGVAGHLKINDGAMIGAQSGVSGSVPPKALYFGTPAIDAGLRKRIIASEKRIPEVVRFVKKQIKETEKT